MKSQFPSCLSQTVQSNGVLLNMVVGNATKPESIIKMK